MARKTRKPVHPGGILKRLFLEPLEMSNYALAKSLGVTQTRIGFIVREKTGISADMALRLGRYFNTGPELWMNMQSNYELELAQEGAWASIEEMIEPRPLEPVEV